jgi:hypothetical protein
MQGAGCRVQVTADSGYMQGKALISIPKNRLFAKKTILPLHSGRLSAVTCTEAERRKPRQAADVGAAANIPKTA